MRELQIKETLRVGVAGTVESSGDAIERARRLMQEGDAQSAASLLVTLLSSEPRLASGWYQLGNAHRIAGRFEAALESYRKAIELDPLMSAALCNCGVALMALGRADEALVEFDRAIEMDSTDSIAVYNRALAQIALGDRSKAFHTLGRAVELNPSYVEPYLSRAWVHEDSGRFAEALADLDRAYELRPQVAAIVLRCADMLAKLKCWPDALQAYERALVLEPSNYVAILHRGNVCRELEDFEEALKSYDRAIEIDDARLDAHFNRGLVLEQLGRVPEALRSFEAATAIKPDFAPAQHSRSLALLLLGRLTEGFGSFEWRWKNRLTLDPMLYRGNIHSWDGTQDVRHKMVLVFAEQGLGDTIQFCRFIRLLAARGARIVFEVQAPLLGLMRHVAGVSAVISPIDTVESVDLKCALLSLARLLGTTLQSIPNESKYLASDPERVRRWQARLGRKTRPRVGLTWSGNPDQPEDRYRSIPLSTLVRALPAGFDYFCLQRGIRPADREVLESTAWINNYDVDLLETAAICECMDLIISTCTSIAHLAGALGRPVWVLLSFNADWRWFLDRPDSPWYSTARLYRQKKLGDWTEPLARVTPDLENEFGST